MNSNTEPRGLTLKNYLAYGVGDIYGGGAFTLLNLLFLNYLTDIARLPSALAGTVLLIGIFWDGGIDPFIGLFSDRTRSRFGRRRVYFLAGLLPILATFILLWVPVGGSAVLKMLYYTLAYLLFALAFSIVMVPYNTLPAEMTDDFRVRNKMMGTRMAFSNFSSLLAGVLPLMIVNLAIRMGASPAQGYLTMGAAFGLLYALPWILVFLFTWERPEASAPPQMTASQILGGFVHDFRKSLRNSSFRLHMGLYLFGYAALDLMMNLAVYFVTYYLGQKQHFPLVLGALIGAQMAALPLYVWVSSRFGKAHAFILGLSIWSLAMAGALFMYPGQPWYFMIIMGAVAGLGASGVAYVPWAILPEVTDVDELLHGERREGIYAGCMSFLRKAAQALAVFLVGIVLDVIGYVPGVAQSTNTLRMLQWLFGLGPVIFLACAAFFARLYPITPKRHRLLVAELARRRQGGLPGDMAPEVAEACNAMTGKSIRAAAETVVQCGKG